MLEQPPRSRADQPRRRSIAPEPIAQGGRRTSARLPLGRLQVPGSEVIAAKAKPFLDRPVDLHLRRRLASHELAQNLHHPLPIESTRRHRHHAASLGVDLMPGGKSLDLFERCSDQVGKLFRRRME